MGFPFHPPSHRSATQGGKNPQEREKKQEAALRYIETVRDFLEKDNPDKVDEFFDVLADFKNHRIGTAEVASRVKALFRDCPALLAGFNVFLPEGYKTQVEADELAARVVTDLSLDDHNDDLMSE